MRVSKILHILVIGSLIAFLGSCGNYCAKQVNLGYKASLYDGAERQEIGDAMMLSIGFFTFTLLLWLAYSISKTKSR